MIGVLLLLLSSQAASGAPSSPQLKPFFELEECRKQVDLDDESSRARFLKCALPLFSSETPRKIAERIAFWSVEDPVYEKLHVCSKNEAEKSGDRYHSDAIGCFRILKGDQVGPGYVFLRKAEKDWLILDVKF